MLHTWLLLQLNILTNNQIFNYNIINSILIVLLKDGYVPTGQWEQWLGLAGLGANFPATQLPDKIINE